MIIATAKEFNCRPSDIIGVDDAVTRFCFDTACVYLMRLIDDGNVPRYEDLKHSNRGLEALMA